MSIHLMRFGIQKANGAGGGGGSPTTIFAPTVTPASDDNNPNYFFRMVPTLAVTLAGQVRVTFKASSTALNIAGASFGKFSSYPAVTTATPLPFLFSGSATASISANNELTSDWLNVSGLSITSGQQAVVILDTGANGGTKYSSGNTNVDTFYGAGSSSGLADPGSAADSLGFSWGLTKIETQ